MVGIYKITNSETGQVYIGQSKNLEKRKYQHWHSPNNGKLDLEIFNNPSRFTFEVLEECPVDKLTERESFYIKQYDSTLLESGYNCAVGYSRPGVTNSNAKLDMIDVMSIRKDYANHKNKKEVFEKYKDRINWRGFEKIWSGETWPDVMMHVYTEENKYYYTHDAKSVPQQKTFTDEEVIEFRRRYVNETGREIYNSINGQERCVYNTFEAALIGLSFTHLPVYKKKEKKWINISL